MLMCLDKFPRRPFGRRTPYLLFGIVGVLIDSHVIDFVVRRCLLEQIAKSFGKAARFLESSVAVVFFAGAHGRTFLWKSPLTANGRIQQNVHRFGTDLAARPTRIQADAIHLHDELIVQKPPQIAISLGKIIILSLFQIGQLPLQPIPMKLPEMRFVQLSIERNGIGPIILSGRVGIVQEMIVRPVKRDVQRGIRPRRQIVVPLPRGRPPPLPRPGQPPRRHLVRRAHEGLPHGHFQKVARIGLDIARLNLEDVDLRRSPSHPRVQPVMLHPIARTDELGRPALVGADAGAPRPDVLGGAHVGVAGEVAQEPKRRPEPTHVVLAREAHLRFHDAAGEAELVPRLEHGGAEVLGDFGFAVGHVVKAHDFGIVGLRADD
mmetsp:Transcript_28430/g.57457  ORF Transcript_28430/g.57457 Transcript_28430/m.57457 type:complete len:377 (-) Transcript_28430:902-2032(-)